MIRAAAASNRLVQRLRARAERMLAGRAAAKAREHRRQGAEWRSAAALWPDFTGDPGPTRTRS
jgi:hypothetical protein